eukprot:g4925.t1
MNQIKTFFKRKKSGKKASAASSPQTPARPPRLRDCSADASFLALGLNQSMLQIAAHQLLEKKISMDEFFDIRKKHAAMIAEGVAPAASSNTSSVVLDNAVEELQQGNMTKKDFFQLLLAQKKADDRHLGIESAGKSNKYQTPVGKKTLIGFGGGGGSGSGSGEENTKKGRLSLGSAVRSSFSSRRSSASSTKLRRKSFFTFSNENKRARRASLVVIAQGELRKGLITPAEYQKIIGITALSEGDTKAAAAAEWAAKELESTNYAKLREKEGRKTPSIEKSESNQDDNDDSAKKKVANKITHTTPSPVKLKPTSSASDLILEVAAIKLSEGTITEAEFKQIIESDRNFRMNTEVPIDDFDGEKDETMMTTQNIVDDEDESIFSDDGEGNHPLSRSNTIPFPSTTNGSNSDHRRKKNVAKTPRSIAASNALRVATAQLEKGCITTEEFIKIAT